MSMDGANGPMKTMKAAAKKRYKTYEVCKLFDVSKATLFRWEREGLISGPPRDWRNWRLYTLENIQEIRRIIQNRSMVV
jgi:adenine-specific DNA-methyltransferase